MAIVIDERERRAGDEARVPARALIGSAIVFLVAAGGLLWWYQGAGVFSGLVLAGIAWCF